MKNAAITGFLIILMLPLGCTDVIDVDVPTAAPRLVIEASIDWEKGTSGNEQQIGLSLSTPYFDNLDISPVTGASVKVIKDDDQSEFIFADQGTGRYSTNEFVAEMNASYTLEVIYKGEMYVATEIMTPVTQISRVYQSTENGFDGNALEVNIDFEDPQDSRDFYLSRFQRRGDLLPALFDVKDEFTNGNLMSIFYEKLKDEDTGEVEFAPGDIVDIQLYGLSERYYNFIKLLIQQSGGAGGPFTTIPAEIKGNCINVSNPDNYAYGYFRLSEYDKKTYLFK